MDWLFVKSSQSDDLAHFQQLQKWDDDYQLDMCVSLAGAMPSDACIPMNSDFPNEIALGDSLRSNGNLLVVNDRTRELFEGAGVKNVEWLPVTVLNHKKKLVKDKYYIINILSAVDCIDTKKSVVVWNKIDPDSINSASTLVLDEARLPTDFKLFRPVHMQDRMMIHRSLADAIVAEKLTGFLFIEVSEVRS